MKYNIFRSNPLILISLLFLTMPLISQETEKRPLMRFPDIHGDKVVFVHGEDIWIASIDGGVAQRLTIHDGEEEFPKFSPDGKLIAFTAQYDGNRDVYVMDVHGGNISRVTYHPYRDDVVGWHPVKNKIIFRSRRDSYQYYNRLFL
ncbi:MAG: peptidase S41, partial [candidate division KSB1 bacterium]|nr:peptidase S41 [candidate division KSB1 bacterium]